MQIQIRLSCCAGYFPFLVVVVCYFRWLVIFHASRSTDSITVTNCPKYTISAKDINYFGSDALQSVHYLGTLKFSSRVQVKERYHLMRLDDQLYRVVLHMVKF